MKTKRISPILSFILFFTFLSPLVFGSQAMRDSVRHIPTNDVIAMDQMYTQMESQGLFIDDPVYRAEVQQAASMARASQQVNTIQQANDAARTLVAQRSQTEFQQALQGAKDVLKEAGVTLDDSGIAQFSAANTAAQALINDEIAHLESQGSDISATDKARLGELKIASGATQAMISLAATIKTYGEISDKKEAADRGGTKETFDVSAAVVKELLTQVKTLADTRSSAALGELITSRSLPASLDGMTGEAIAAHYDKLHAAEASRESWQSLGGKAADAIRVIDGATKTVDTIDKMLHDKDFEKIQKNEYASDGAKDMAQMALASGEALRGLASALGADMGNPAAQILTAGGEGLRAIGNAVNTGARLEEIKRQGGMGGIESNFQAAIEGLPAGIRIRQDQEDGTILIPDGSGSSSGTVSLSPDKMNDLMSAISVFATLQGRNPTQEEINQLAAGGRVPIDGMGQMSMNNLSDPLRRTDYDMQGARRAEQDTFINQAIGDLVNAAIINSGAKTDEDKKRAREDYMNENFTIYDVDTGKRRPMTQQEIRERLEELRELDDKRGGSGVTPNMLASDLLNQGAVGDKLQSDVDKQNQPDTRSRLEQLADAIKDPSLSAGQRAEKEREYLDELERIRQANQNQGQDEDGGKGKSDEEGDGTGKKDEGEVTPGGEDTGKSPEDKTDQTSEDTEDMTDADVGEAVLNEMLTGSGGCSLFGPSVDRPRSVSSGNGFKRLDNLGGTSTRRGPDTGGIPAGANGSILRRGPPPRSRRMGRVWRLLICLSPYQELYLSYES